MRRITLVLAFFTLTIAAGAAAQDSAARGQRWEKTINATTTHPWSSTRLCVQYTSPSAQTFTGLGFWDTRDFGANPSVDPDKDVFKVHAAFNELGTWSWQLINNAAAGCVSTAGFTPSSGTINVTADTTGLQIYSIGPVRLGSPPRFLLRSGAGILTPFHWIGDTSWFGPGSSFLTSWRNYVIDRKNKNYTVIQVSMPLGAGQPADVTGRKPFVTYDVFGNPTACTGIVPRAACLPYKAYWDYWDSHINEINLNGMLASVIGIYKRTNDSANWPTLDDARGYGRWTAARLAGNHTTLAPGFDELPGRNQTFTGTNCGEPNPVTPGSENQACRAREVGTAIRDAILLQTTIDAPKPRIGVPLTALVTHHIGGGCSDGLDGAPPNQCLADYWLDKFQDETWLDFQLFQSGQGGNPGSQTQLQALATRSTKRPLTLYNTAPTKPIINGEAIYDQFGWKIDGTTNCTSNPIDYGMASALYGEYRARQAAFNTLLSGGAGFTHGVGGTWDWNGNKTCRTVSESLASPSSTQIGNIKLLFQPFRWNRLLPDCQTWGSTCTDIKNADQGSVPQDQKRMFARDSMKAFAFAYLPDNLADATLKLDLGDLAAFIPGPPWSTNWYDPRRGCTCPATAVASGTNTYTFTRPSAGDWGLVIRNTDSHPTLAVPACNPGC